MRVLVDASALIALGRIGALELLRRVFGTIHTTHEVLGEVLMADRAEAEVIEAALEEGWIQTVQPVADPSDAPPLGLDPGEASLFLAWREEDLLLLDDRSARRLAQVRGMRRTGVLGILLLAFRERLLDRERALRLLDDLVEAEFHMDARLYRDIRRRIEEGGG